MNCQKIVDAGVGSAGHVDAAAAVAVEDTAVMVTHVVAVGRPAWLVADEGTSEHHRSEVVEVYWCLDGPFCPSVAHQLPAAQRRLVLQVYSIVGYVPAGNFALAVERGIILAGAPPQWLVAATGAKSLHHEGVHGPQLALADMQCLVIAYVDHRFDSAQTSMVIESAFEAASFATAAAGAATVAVVTIAAVPDAAEPVGPEQRAPAEIELASQPRFPAEFEHR